MAKKRRKSDLNIYELEGGSYGIFWKDKDIPKMRLTVKEEGDELHLRVHVDSLSLPSGKPSLSVVPEVSNVIRVVVA